MRSLKHAAGPQFGSICFGGLIMVVVNEIRRLARNQRQQGSFLGCIAACLLSCLAELLEYLTKMTTIMASITGEKFLDAGKSCMGLLKRNAMDAYTNWWLPEFVVNGMALVISVVWASICAAIAWAAWSGKSDASGVTVGIFVVCLALTFTVITAVGGVLLACTDTVFLCYAIDKDTSQCHHAEVHEIYANNPGIFVVAPTAAGAAMARPGGYPAVPPGAHVSYGMPIQQQGPGGAYRYDTPAAPQQAQYPQYPPQMPPPAQYPQYPPQGGPPPVEYRPPLEKGPGGPPKV